MLNIQIQVTQTSKSEVDLAYMKYEPYNIKQNKSKFKMRIIMRIFGIRTKAKYAYFNKLCKHNKHYRIQKK